jgi:serine/threonine-protein kinase
MVQPIDGKYQIIERLGRGGMGEVYKALHTHLGVIRVIKTMRARLIDDPLLHQRFVREAKLATRIQHENVAMLHDFSALPDGSFYMVWEYIQGTNLAIIVRREGKLAPRVAIDVAIQTLHGLEAIHAAGIIHRDVSPENIMVFKEPSGSLRVKVIDLGIAKSEMVDGAVTSTGMFVGKWKYASPEHLGLLPEGQVIDGRADLFSFGIVFYEMLAGRAPYQATTPGQYLLLQLKETPNPVALQNLSFPEAPGLEKILERALEKERDKRYPSAKAFAEALSILRSTLPVEEDDPATVLPAIFAGAGPHGQAAIIRTPTPTLVPPARTFRTGSPAVAPPLPPSAQVGQGTTVRMRTPVPAPPAPTVPTDSRPIATTSAAPRTARSAKVGAVIGLVVFVLVPLGGAGLWFLYTTQAGERPVAATTTSAPQTIAVPPSRTAVEVAPPAPAATAPATTPGPTTATTAVPGTAPTAAIAPQTAAPAIVPPVAAITPATPPTPPTVTAPTIVPPNAPVAKPIPVPPATTPAKVQPGRPETGAQAPPDEGIPKGDKIPTSVAFGRRSELLVSSDAWTADFHRGIIQNYEDLHSGGGVDWAAVARGVTLSQYKVVLGKLQNLSSYDSTQIRASLETQLQKDLDGIAGNKGILHAQIAIVWASSAPRSPHDVEVEMVFREPRGQVLAKLHHRVSARSAQSLAEDLIAAISDFIQDHPIVQ